MVMENLNCSETYATLQLVGESVVPAAITEALQIQPTFQVAVGEANPKRSKPRTKGIWALTTEGRLDSTELEDHVSFLLELLPSNPRSVVPAEARFEIVCLWRSATGHGGPSLSASIMARLAEKGLDLDFDFYSDV
jgi:hypothetical protein